MGATIPLASEGCQRQLGASTNRLVPVLFFVNTVGASLGAYLASAWLLPALGQRLCLMVAVGCNGAAAMLITTLARSRDVAPRKRLARRVRGWLTAEEIFGGVLGFLALGYEMALFRLLALTHQPLPTTFATGLAGYLLAWSVGVALAVRLSRGFSTIALGCALGVVGVLYQYDHEIATGAWPLAPAVALYTLPCVGFGVLYGQLVARSAHAWGRDVGRYAAVNTLGSCAGVLFFTLIGYEMPQEYALRAMALGLCAVAMAETATGPVAPRWAFGIGSAGAGVGAVALLLVGVRVPYTESQGRRTYWGRDGVVEVAADHNVFLDGLWHTKLSDGGDHIGSRYSWLMSVAAALAHDNPHPTRALVIGGGVGISSGSLSRHPGARSRRVRNQSHAQAGTPRLPRADLACRHHPGGSLVVAGRPNRVGADADDLRHHPFRTSLPSPGRLEPSTVARVPPASQVPPRTRRCARGVLERRFCRADPADPAVRSRSSSSIGSPGTMDC